MNSSEAMPLAVTIPAAGTAPRDGDRPDPQAQITRAIDDARERLAARERAQQLSAAEAMLVRRQLELYAEHHASGGATNAWDGRALIGTVLVTAGSLAVVDAGRHAYLALPAAALPEAAAVGTRVGGSAQSGLTLADREPRERERAPERGL